jgi:hypothetical protein
MGARPCHMSDVDDQRVDHQRVDDQRAHPRHSSYRVPPAHPPGIWAVRVTPCPLASIALRPPNSPALASWPGLAGRCNAATSTAVAGDTLTHTVFCCTGALGAHGAADFSPGLEGPPFPTRACVGLPRVYRHPRLTGQGWWSDCLGATCALRTRPRHSRGPAANQINCWTASFMTPHTLRVGPVPDGGRAARSRRDPKADPSLAAAVLPPLVSHRYQHTRTVDTRPVAGHARHELACHDS